LASFLLLSFPAISQSVTIVNGDTLVCFPDSTVRQIIVDLEEGDLCKKELESYKKDAGSYLSLIKIYQEEIQGYKDIITKKDGTIKELKLQITLKDKEILVHKTAANSKFYKGLGIGAATGGLLVLLISIL